MNTMIVYECIDYINKQNINKLLSMCISIIIYFSFIKWTKTTVEHQQMEVCPNSLHCTATIYHGDTSQREIHK
jgi:hypothetical protein